MEIKRIRRFFFALNFELNLVREIRGVFLCTELLVTMNIETIYGTID